MKNETETLNEAIISLKSKRALELKLLKEHFYFVHEELRPINLIKNTFKEVTSSPGLKNNVINHIIGLSTGYLSKKVIIGSSHNPIKKILGTALQFAVANAVSKHSDKIKSTGLNLVGRILKYVNQSTSKGVADE